MTYCAGLLLEDGLVMIADTRTNAGVDQISTYRKLHVFEKPGERVIVISTSGNLSVSQTALSLLREGLVNPDTGELETLDQAPTMFRAAQLIYAAGNFIECGPETPYLQIGETKYGKPILDRAITFRSDLYDALKIGLISFDSTMRSNLAVGLPIDLIVIRRDRLTAETRHRIETDDAYFHDLGERWSAALRAAHNAIPAPPYRAVE